LNTRQASIILLTLQSITIAYRYAQWFMPKPNLSIIIILAITTLITSPLVCGWIIANHPIKLMRIWAFLVLLSTGAESIALYSIGFTPSPLVDS
jgi:hypothetical protein